MVWNLTESLWRIRSHTDGFCTYAANFEEVVANARARALDLLDGLEDKGQLPQAEIAAGRYVVQNSYSQAYKLFEWFVRELKAGRVQQWVAERHGGIMGWGLDLLSRAGQHFERLRDHNQPLPQFKQFAYADLVSWVDEEDSNEVADEAEGYSAREVAMELNEGWTWQWLVAEDAGLEGELMGNCIGDYAHLIDDGNCSILSLKDANNVPHVDIEFAWCELLDEDVVLQVKGRSNTSPTKYTKQINEYFRQYPASWIPENVQFEAEGGSFYINSPEEMPIGNAHDVTWANSELQDRNIESFQVTHVPVRQDAWGITHGAMFIPAVLHWYDATQTLHSLFEFEDDNSLRECIAAYYNLVLYQLDVEEANKYQTSENFDGRNAPSFDDVRADLIEEEASRGKEAMFALLEAAPMLWVQPEDVPLPELETPQPDQSLPQPTPPTSPWQEGNHADQ